MRWTTFLVWLESEGRDKAVQVETINHAGADIDAAIEGASLLFEQNGGEGFNVEMPSIVCVQNSHGKISKYSISLEMVPEFTICSEL